jgi:phosphopantothenoylcysteine decarboxylase/phosphopantothenate--cysteine ligase
MAKLAAKKCDLIVANDVSEPGSGFAVDTNRVTLVDKSGAEEVPAGPKYEVAHRILDRVVAHLNPGGQARVDDSDDEAPPAKRAKRTKR